MDIDLEILLQRLTLAEAQLAVVMAKVEVLLELHSKSIEQIVEEPNA